VTTANFQSRAYIVLIPSLQENEASEADDDEEEEVVAEEDVARPSGGKRGRGRPKKNAKKKRRKVEPEFNEWSSDADFDVGGGDDDDDDFGVAYSDGDEDYRLVTFALKSKFCPHDLGFFYSCATMF
jgi:hypothetical protein